MLSASLPASSGLPHEGWEFESYLLLNSLLIFGMSAAPVVCLKGMKKGGGLGQRNRSGKLGDRMLHTASYHSEIPTIASGWTSTSTELSVSGIDSRLCILLSPVYAMHFITYLTQSFQKSYVSFPFPFQIMD